mgnify:CR=1 FL=1
MIDEDLFGDQYAFRAKYMNAGGSLAELRGRLTEFSKRTLRRQVLEYVRYTARHALTQPFYPSDAEQELYDLVTKFLEEEGTYSVPDRQRHLTVLVMRKLLASSSVAIAGTLATMRSRLEDLRKSEGQVGNDLLEALLEEEEFEPELLEEWDDRYRYVIELGRMLDPMPEAEHSAENKVNGCVSQVWLSRQIDRSGNGQPRLKYLGDSDAHIVRGLIAILLTLYSGQTPQQILATDALAVFDEFGFRDHLTPQRSNGLRSMVERIRSDAREALAAAS